jgi:hypothetical protein
VKVIYKFSGQATLGRLLPRETPASHDGGPNGFPGLVNALTVAIHGEALAA